MTVLVKTELWEEEHTTPVPLSCIPSELIWEEERYTCSHTFLSNLQLMHCILMLKDLGTEIKIPFASGFPLLPGREKLEKSYELFLVWDSIPFFGNLSPSENWSVITSLFPESWAALSCIPKWRHQCEILHVITHRTTDFAPYPPAIDVRHYYWIFCPH